MSEITFGEAYISLINTIIDDYRAEIADDEAKKERNQERNDGYL